MDMNKVKYDEALGVVWFVLWPGILKVKRNELVI